MTFNNGVVRQLPANHCAESCRRWVGITAVTQERWAAVKWRCVRLRAVCQRHSTSAPRPQLSVPSGETVYLRFCLLVWHIYIYTLLHGSITLHTIGFNPWIGVCVYCVYSHTRTHAMHACTSCEPKSGISTLAGGLSLVYECASKRQPTWIHAPLRLNIWLFHCTVCATRPNKPHHFSLSII